MALLLRQTIPNVHPKTVLSVAFNPARRELFVGGEGSMNVVDSQADGTISCWEIETGKLSSTCVGHLAWVTGLAYW
jgi:WD40 repeat protein